MEHYEGLDDPKDPKDARWHYWALQKVYEKAVYNEEAIDKSRMALDKATAALREQASGLPAAVSAQVDGNLAIRFAEARCQLEAAASAAGDRIVERFTDANVNAKAASLAMNERPSSAFGE